MKIRKVSERRWVLFFVAFQIFEVDWTQNNLIDKNLFDYLEFLLIFNVLERFFFSPALMHFLSLEQNLYTMNDSTHLP